MHRKRVKRRKESVTDCLCFFKEKSRAPAGRSAKNDAFLRKNQFPMLFVCGEAKEATKKTMKSKSGICKNGKQKRKPKKETMKTKNCDKK